MRLLIAAFLVGHGLVHGIMFGLPYIPEARADMRFNPSRSWLLGETRTLAFGFALSVTVAFVVAGVSYLVDAAWWPQAAIVAAALSFLLLALYHSRWLILGYPINIGIAIAAWQA